MYTLSQLNKDFPDDDAILDWLQKERYPGVWYRVKGRKAYVNKEGRHVSPLKGTILEKSTTPLTLWFHAIHLFSTSTHGVSAAELQRTIGVTYKCAFRMCKKIRTLMKEDGSLKGIVEIDETYIGGYRRRGQGGRGKYPVIGIVERGGKVRAEHIKDRRQEQIIWAVTDRVVRGSTIYTDQYKVYRRLKKMGYHHDAVNHSRGEYARGAVHTNTIENFWGQLKRGLRGTYYGVSPAYLQTYVDERTFSWNHRGAVFEALLGKLSS